jgi:hypothetical protein
MDLWGREAAPLGVGPLVEVNTIDPVDTAHVAAAVRSALTDEGAST